MFGQVGLAIRTQLTAASNCEGLFFSEQLSAKSVRVSCQRLQHECREAVAKLNFWRLARHLPPCRPETGNYCEARGRLPEELFCELVRTTGSELAQQAKQAWQWLGRVMNLLAYNLICGIMLEAAAAAEVAPHQLSFKGALQSLNVFLGRVIADTTQASRLYAALLWMVGTHRADNRPDRLEPRLVKRRPKPYKLLQEPRQVARNRLHKKR